MLNRLLNVSLYLGGAPIYWLFGKVTHKNLSVKTHYIQVLGINILVCCSFIIFLISFCAHTIIIRFFRSLALNIPLEISFYILGVLLIICLAVSLEGIVASLLGYNPKSKVISSFINNNFRRRLSIAIALIHQLIIITVIILAFHSSYIVGDEEEEADVYMLYDDMGYIPRWVFTLGFYPESVVARKSLGDDSVVVVPFTKNTLNEALSNGKLVYIASHGAEGFMVLQDGELLWPSDIHTNLVGDDLQYVYLSGCDTGALHNEWQDAFGPVDIKTFDRLSTVVEHIKWLLIDGPKIINSLE